MNSDSAAVAGPPDSPRPRWVVPATLATGVTVFVVVIAYASWLRFEELSTSTWDLGIYQQALWSTSQGRPFYEAADLETGGFGTLLQVHSAFVLYLLVPVYHAIPSAGTLFVVQAAVVGLAALPLYALARALGCSTRRSLLLSILYLTAAPTLTSSLYDFHIEAFLPLVTFTLFWLWQTERYLPAAGIALLSFLTMESAPPFDFAIAAYFLLARARAPASLDARRRDRVIATLRAWLVYLTRPASLASLALAGSSVIAYVALLELRTDWLATYFGLPPFPSTHPGYIIGATPSELGLSLSNLGVGFYNKAAYWALVFALVLFLPFRSPRSLILVAPWLGFTFLSAQLNYVTMGFQYGFLVLPGLFPAAVIGASRLPSLGSLARTAEIRNDPSIATKVGSRPRRAAYTAVVGVVVLTLLANVALSPFDPLMQSTGPGSAYAFTYEVPPGFSSVRDVASLMPLDATVVASDYLFPLVANDVNAYSLFWDRNPFLRLPFNATSLPPYVFLAENRFAAVPDFLSVALYNRSDYGLRALAWSSPVGAVALFERGYSGTPLALESAPASDIVFDPWQLLGSEIGWIMPEPTSTFGAALESTPDASGQLWASPPVNLPAGTYNVTFSVKAWASGGEATPPPTSEALGLEGNPFGAPQWFSENFDFATVGGSEFHTISFTVTTTEPEFDVVLRGYVLSYAVGVGVSEIHIQSVPAGA